MLVDVLLDKQECADALAGKGLSGRASEEKCPLFATASLALLAGRKPHELGDVSAFFVPGRIEVLGKHTDYAGGSSMVAAAERGFCVVAARREDDQVVVTDALRSEAARFAFEPELTPQIGHWSNYPMTVARRLARNFPEARRGADIAFASDLPPAAGMSSSSAMIVATFFALAEVNELRLGGGLSQFSPERKWDCPLPSAAGVPPATSGQDARAPDPLDLAGYLGCIENGQSFGPLAGDRGVGTFGGSEDHTTMLRAEAGRIVQFAYCPVRFQKSIPLPAGYLFAIGVCGVVAEKTGAAREKYNHASQLVSMLMDLWRRETGRDDSHLAAALRSGPDASGRFRQIATSSDPDELLARLEHFILENNEVIPAAGRALETGDLAAFGRAVDRSQWGTEHLLRNQVPETVYLAASARRLGAAAASAFGAGFGGSVWALVPEAEAEGFLAAWGKDYRARYPQRAQASLFFSTAAGPAAFRLG